MQGQLPGEGGLTGTVQARDKNHGGIALDIDVGALVAHERDQLVVDDLDHHLLRLHRGEDVGADGLVLDGVAEFFRDLEADIGVQERLADIFYRLCDVDFGNLSFALQYLEGSFQSFR